MDRFLWRELSIHDPGVTREWVNVMFHLGYSVGVFVADPVQIGAESNWRWEESNPAGFPKGSLWDILMRYWGTCIRAMLNLQQVQRSRPLDGLDAAVGVELAIDVLEMGSDRTDCDHELLGNLLGG